MAGPPANLKYFFAPKRAKEEKFAGLIKDETYQGADCGGKVALRKEPGPQ